MLMLRFDCFRATARDHDGLGQVADDDAGEQDTDGVEVSVNHGELSPSAAAG